MSKQSTVAMTYKSSSGVVYPIKSQDVLGDAEVEFDATIAPGVTEEIDIALPTAKMKAFGMLLKKALGTVATPASLTATIKTNSTSSPANTFAITGANGMGWSTGDALVNPFTTDVTKIYVTNTSATPIIYQHAFNYDESPSSP